MPLICILRDDKVLHFFLGEQALERAVGDFFGPRFGKKPEHAEEHQEDQDIKKELGAFFHGGTSCCQEDRISDEPALKTVKTPMPTPKENCGPSSVPTAASPLRDRIPVMDPAERPDFLARHLADQRNRLSRW